MSFAIIAFPRTGSTHLTNLLHAQRDIFCNGEICHKRKVYVRWDKTDQDAQVLSELAELRNRAPQMFLDRIFAMDYGRREVGFKIFEGQNKGIFTALLDNSEIKKIVLFRRNVLANYSSKLIALESGKYQLGKKAARRGPSDSPLVYFEGKAFVRFCRRYHRYYSNIMSRLREIGQYYYLINYEDINEPEVFANLLRFLGSDVADAELQGRIIKQNPPHIVSRFANADDVEEFLRQHNLMHWAYEGELSLGPLDASTDDLGDVKEADEVSENVLETRDDMSEGRLL